jgi:hypothetical protein
MSQHLTSELPHLPSAPLASGSSHHPLEKPTITPLFNGHSKDVTKPKPIPWYRKTKGIAMMIVGTLWLWRLSWAWRNANFGLVRGNGGGGRSDHSCHNYNSCRNFDSCHNDDPHNDDSCHNYHNRHIYLPYSLNKRLKSCRREGDVLDHLSTVVTSLFVPSPLAEFVEQSRLKYVVGA